MCTVTITRKTGGFQVIMNRDERLDREEEKPPQEIADGIFAPLDPVSGGTWIAHNKAGYWGCILNGYFEEEQRAGLKSRGQILPNFLSKENPLDNVRELHAQDYPSFRLVLGSPTEVKMFIWDGRNFGQQDFYAARNGTMFVSSSSLRQSEIIAHRKNLFLNHKASAIQFHTIHENPETDPLMLRSYSRTKSITVMNVGEENSNFSYAVIPEDFSYKRGDVKTLIDSL